jgi:hypothetical protein
MEIFNKFQNWLTANVCIISNPDKFCYILWQDRLEIQDDFTLR